MNKQVKVFKDTGELNNFAAEKFIEIADSAINSERDSFAVALAGGSTPKALYQLLSSDKYRDKVDWAKVFFFFGDERNVLPDDAESNFRMANESFFKPLAIHYFSVLRWNTEIGEAQQIAEDYDSTIRLFFEEENFPRFDLILLGMGADGHTVSLFPFTEALRETEKLAVENYVEKLDTMRLTLTFPVINNARNVMFLVAGEEKAETLKAVLEGKFEPEKLPSQNVKPENGNLFWLVDEKAASLLNK